MAILRADYALFLDSAPAAPSSPRGLAVGLTPLATAFSPGADDEFYGPFSAAFSRAEHGEGWLLSIIQEVKGDAGAFFASAHQVLVGAVAGREGWVLDVLRLWPHPVEKLSELPDDPLPEDLFSIAFRDQGEHGVRAETIGLSKLGQKELSFRFQGLALVEDATLFCAHFADWVFGHRWRVEGGQKVAFGLDTLTFRGPTGGDVSTDRGWHPPLIQRLLSAEHFPGVGALEVLGHLQPGGTEPADLTAALERARSQRELLEAHGLSGDSPHLAHQAQACACLGKRPFRGVRVEPHTQKDSGWHFCCLEGHGSERLETYSLGELVARVPQIIPVLALPPGVTARFGPEGVELDLERVSQFSGDGEDSDVSPG